MHCRLCNEISLWPTSRKRPQLLITVRTNTRLWKSTLCIVEVCQFVARSAFNGSTECNYTIVPAIEDNSDNSEFELGRYLPDWPWIIFYATLLYWLSNFLVGSLPAGLLLHILRPKPQQLKRSVAKSPRHKFTENVRLWCLIQLHCNLSLPLGSRGPRMMQDVSIKCLTISLRYQTSEGNLRQYKRCFVKKNKKLLLIHFYLRF